MHLAITDIRDLYLSIYSAHGVVENNDIKQKNKNKQTNLKKKDFSETLRKIGVKVMLFEFLYYKKAALAESRTDLQKRCPLVIGHCFTNTTVLMEI